MNNKLSFGAKPRIIDVEQVRKNWGWFLALGILNIVMGVLAISYSAVTTLFSLLAFGAILGLSAIFQIVQAFWASKWSGFFLSLFVGILYGITSILCFKYPLASAESLTLLIAMFCFMGGLFRIIVALTQHYEGRGWILANGIVTLLLGMMIISQWPVSGLWVIGVIVGVDMLFVGMSWATLAMGVRRYLS